jgi:hypothetical protein
MGKNGSLELGVGKSRQGPLLLTRKVFVFIYRKFTIYSTNGAISKYVVRKHLCGVIVQ